MPGSDLVGTQLLLDGLRFAEAPRWYGGRLWFSDIFDQRVLTVDELGRVETVATFTGDELPCGLGFLPGGTPLVVDMHRPVVLRLDSDGPRVHADLTALAVGGLNDMVVASDGRAYVGSMGIPGSPSGAADGRIILVEPDGTARVVADGLMAPNGAVLTPDGRTYVVAEFPASRLTSFHLNADGTLGPRRIWADLRPGSADGIAVDADGAIWTASPRENECRRILEGGHVTDIVRVADRMPLACALGGADGHTLFILSAVGGEERIRRRTNTSVVEIARVRVPAYTEQ
ncbi:SMP-30/gluconolactonase/LRE family protein [Pseudonocardia ailaonensis]|uniref:SMP-30/gluconolactonase/LRE family protein n=1 Tax=Pseudonocardia ailaonensis TaxID=367279 RepID=A0ABN2NEJ4_9PSEU